MGIPLNTYAKALRKHQTRGERSLVLLRLMGYKPQEPVGGFIPDFYSKYFKVAIEVNGSVHDNKAVKARDKKKRRKLLRQGIITLYIKDARARKHPIICITEVLVLSLTWRLIVGVGRTAKRLKI